MSLQVIKEDIERSLRVRFDLLGEELRQSSGDEEVKELETGRFRSVG